MAMRSCDDHFDRALEVFGKSAKSFGVQVVDSDECPFCQAEESEGDRLEAEILEDLDRN